MTVEQKSPVRANVEADGTLLHLVLDRPKGNVLDRPMITALREALDDLAPETRAILIEGEGKHFSFGASVEEHAPDQVAEMLPAFHALFTDLLDSGRVLLSAVRGQCLGGGLELAAFCHRLFAAPGAKLGQPEIKLGVIAPVGSIVLPARIGQAQAEDLLLTGRSVGAEEGLAMGLVDALAEDPAAAARAWHATHLQPLSAAALRHALRAVRRSYHASFARDLADVERLYLEDLMQTHDAKEGIAAFLEKRKPVWTHR